MTANLWRLSGRYRIPIRGKVFRTLSTKQINFTENEVEEIKVPVPWGHIAGKWWGSKNQRPILCVHGWQDNANTFNTLIPRLSSDRSFLAIDLPGHGLSSHLNKGLFYKTYEMAATFKRLQDHFNWDKMSFMGHSYGAACSFLFSACFSKEVDFLIAIDNIKPISLDPETVIKSGSRIIEKLLLYERLSFDTAPAYSKDELLQRWVKSTSNSLNLTSCEILMERGTKIVDGLFKLRRDCRVKANFASGFTQKELLKLADSVRCNVLFLKAKNSPTWEREEHTAEVVEVMKKSAKRFDYHEFSGTHHIHLNNPEIIAPVINSFISSVTAKIDKSDS